MSSGGSSVCACVVGHTMQEAEQGISLFLHS